MSKRDADQLAKELRRYLAATKSRFTIEKLSGHWHIVNENGRTIMTFPGTPSDHRFRNNAIARLRQHGVIPPGWRG